MSRKRRTKSIKHVLHVGPKKSTGRGGPWFTENEVITVWPRKKSNRLKQNIRVCVCVCVWKYMDPNVHTVLRHTLLALCIRLLHTLPAGIHDPSISRTRHLCVRDESRRRSDKTSTTWRDRRGVLLWTKRRERRRNTRFVLSSRSSDRLDVSDSDSLGFKVCSEGGYHLLTWLS